MKLINDMDGYALFEKNENLIAVGDIKIIKGLAIKRFDLQLNDHSLDLFETKIGELNLGER